MDQLIEQLGQIVGPRFVLHDPDDLIAYDCDAYTIQKGTARAVVLPNSTAQVAAVVQHCHRQGIPFIPRGAGTGRSGGATPLGGEVIIGLSRLNRVIEVDVENQRATVEAGYINLKLSQAVAGDGYYYAPDPSSQQSCTLGGNVAENSGGPHCLKYGVTSNHVLGVTLVLPDGQVLRLGGKAVDTPGYDLVGVLVGSEGTLGIVTEITVRLLKKPQATRTILALFDSTTRAADAVAAITARGIIPAALEMMDRQAIRAVERGNFPVGYPENLPAVLIAEVDGLEAGLGEQAQQILDVCRECGAFEFRLAQSPEERARWWANRKTAFGAMGKLAPDYYVQDGVLPRSRLTWVLQRIEAVGQKYNLMIANVFHAGDGNLHPLIAYDHRVPGEVERTIAAGSEILAACVEAGGSISGEHGIGIEKKNEMHLVYGEHDMAVQLYLREVFNPDELCNPGKVFPTPSRCAEVKQLVASSREHT